jgi:hypothetical protein
LVEQEKMKWKQKIKEINHRKERGGRKKKGKKEDE